MIVALVGLISGQAAASHTSSSSPNDPLFERTAAADQWGPEQIRVEPAWHRSVGRGAVVAIVDSGIDLDHEDQANARPGRTFLDCGNSGCGNGDWQSGPPSQRDGDPHGTHVAGIAAAATNNATGIAGVAPRARLMAVRVLDDEGSASFADVARGIRFATDRGADVINLSLGALPGTQAITIVPDFGADDVRRAIQYATRRGVVVVAASGNELAPLCDTPAFDPGAICVTATTTTEAKASYANLPVKPPDDDAIDGVAAPGGELTTIFLCGEGIVSTVPAGTGGDYCDYPANKAYDEFVGTSMASPHAAGVAALLVAQGCDRGEVHEIFRTTSRQGPTEQRGVYTPAYGYGILDADAATQSALTVC